MEEKSKPKRRSNKQTNCRYGAECRNIDKGCKFVHPTTNSSAGEAVDVSSTTNKQNQKKPKETKRDKSKTPCRYGMDCLHAKCPYFHHPSAAGVGSSPSSGEGSSPKCAVVPPPAPAAVAASGETSSSPPPTPTRKATNKKKCRWGAGCRNKKCAFTHPPPHAASTTASEGGESVTKSPVVKSPARRRNSLGEVYSVDTPPTGFQSTETPSQQKTKIIFPTLSLSPENDHVLQPTSNKTSPPLSNPPGFLDHSPLFAKGMAGSNNSTPLSNGLVNGIKSNVYSYLPNTSTPTTMAEEAQQRTPLYSKEVLSAFNPLPVNQSAMNGASMNGGAFNAVNHSAMNGGGYTTSRLLQSALGNGGGAHCLAMQQVQQRLNGDDPQNLPIDADWLHEILGFDGLDINEPAASQKLHHNHPDMTAKPGGVVNGGHTNAIWEKSLETLPHQPQTPVADVAPKAEELERRVEVSQEPIDPYDSEEEKSGVILISEDEISQSRRAALELRLESQQSAHQNADFFFSLLEKCRTNQKKVQSALEEAMDPMNDGAKDLDEANVMALLELNELLIGAIGVAESSEVHKSFTGNNGKDVTATVKAKPPEPKCEPPTKVIEKPSPPKTDTTVAKGKEKQAKPKKAKKEVQFSNADTATKKAPDAPDKKVYISDDDKLEPKIDPVEAAKQEKEKIARLMQEARQQAAAAKEKKKSKKSKKFDKWVKEQEQAKESRAKSWEKKIGKENDYIGLIQKLVVAEFLRQSKEKAMGLTSDRVLSDPQAADIIENECREAYHAIFRELKVRVIVAGSDNKELNGRNGTIRYWDKDKKKFCVGLDTKKTTDSDEIFLEPEVLDVAVSTRPGKSEKSKPASSYDLEVSDVMTYGGVSLGLNFILKKSHINALGSAENTKIGLEAFCSQRDDEDRQKKLEEERERAEEEEARKRRAARKAQENAAWEKRKEQMRRDKEEYERMKREWRMNDDDDEEECRCPRCRFGDRFSNRGGAFFFNIGGLPFRVRFDDCESDEESFFDEFDDRWEEQMLEEKREENRKMAKILGVEPNADERTLKVAYRKLALQYHPDKWRSDSDHGMSKKDAENKFKTIQSAYDHLMSNFDNSDEEFA
ncbi:hypothetical protein ACHAXM_009303 [Skeletonema potamos]